LDDDVHNRIDAARRGVVGAIAQRDMRIGNDNTTERFRIQLATLAVRNFGKSNAAEHYQRRSI
jgi:hypothetical protein